MPGLLNVTYRYYPVFVPHWIALHGVILPRSQPKGEHEVSFEQEATKQTKLCLLRCLPFKTYFRATGVSLFGESRDNRSRSAK